MYNIVGCVILVWGMWGGGMVLQGSVFLSTQQAIICGMLIGRFFGTIVAYGLYTLLLHKKIIQIDEIPSARPIKLFYLYFISILYDISASGASMSYNQLSKHSGKNIAITSAFVSLSSYIPIIFGKLCYKEKTNFKQNTGIFLAITGGILLSLNINQSDAESKSFLTVLYTLISFLGWGCSYTIASSIYKFSSSINTILRTFCLSSFTLLLIIALPFAWYYSIWSWNKWHFIQLAGAQFMWTSTAPVYTYIASTCGATRGSVLCAGHTLVPVIIGIGVMGNQTNRMSICGIILSLCSLTLVAKDESQNIETTNV